jgi:DNA-binding response OmpR family regulator
MLHSAGEEPARDLLANNAGTAPDFGFTGKTVLIADDDCDVAQALAIRLNQIGVKSVRTSDALHALVGIHRNLPDLIIMDVNIPSGNGLAACEMLASDPHRAKVPVLVFTGRSDAETINRCRALNLHYVHKAPGSWDRLRSLVCWLLELNPAVMASEARASGHGTEMTGVISNDRQ